jgi:Zn-finger nucleic acid-binding protein
MKKCPNCNQEFEPVTYRGVEQLYCSKKCRTRQGNLRHKQKLMNNGMEQSMGNYSKENLRAAEEQRENYRERQGNLFEQQQSIINPNVLRYIEQSYEARTDAYKFELKYDNALKEIEKLKQEIVSLELELDAEPEPKSGFLGALDDLPEWLTPAIGKLLQSEKVQKFVIAQIPEPQNT